jgi:predicted ThiF/HesA family dinucleotide-utilizing enzyme
MSLEDMEMRKVPRGEVTLVGLGRLGFRTALHLMQVHRGGPQRITAIDGQRISPDDLIFRMLGAQVGAYKVAFLETLAGPDSSREIVGIPWFVSRDTLEVLRGDVVCIEIAGGDTLPVTAAIIRHAQEIGARTVSTMGAFGIGEEKIIATDIGEADSENPIVAGLTEYGVKNHLLVGTGKLIRDWEPVTPYVLDRISHVMVAEILKLLEGKTR